MNTAAFLLLAVATQNPATPAPEARERVPMAQRAVGAALAGSGALALSAVGLGAAAVVTTLLVAPPQALPAGVTTADAAVVAVPVLLAGTVAAGCLVGAGVLVGTRLGGGTAAFSPPAALAQAPTQPAAAPRASDAAQKKRAVRNRKDDMMAQADARGAR